MAQKKVCSITKSNLLSSLKKFAICQGIIHGFNANEVIANEFISQGFLLGIGSHITKHSLITKNIASISIESIVLESDAPYMPAFGKTISSGCDCFLYGQIVAKCTNINLIDVISRSNQNICDLFKHS